MSSLTFEPLVPPALWIALALVGGCALAWQAWRRPAAIHRARWLLAVACAGIALAAIMLVLLNPIWLEPIPPPQGKPLLTILIDRTGSMTVQDAPDDKSRLDRAAQLARPLVERLNGDFDVQLRSFAATTSTISATQLSSLRAEGDTTDLAAALSESFDSSRVQGQAIVLLSDGIHNQGGTDEVLRAIATAKAMAVPVFTSTVGGNASLNDLELTLKRQQELGFVGQQIPVHVRVQQRGRVAGQANLVLLHEGSEIGRQQVSLAQDSATATQFQVEQPKAGLYRYEVRVEHFPDEAAVVNNTATLVVRVIDEPIRVLLLEGKPYWDGKFLVKTLARDTSLELDAVVQVASGRYLQRSLRLAEPAADAADQPATATRQREETTRVLQQIPESLESSEKLAEYQVLVLGRDAEAFLTPPVLERIRNWVSRDGGSLVCYRGSPVANVNQQLARLMPVRWDRATESRFRLQFTPRGQDLNWVAGVEAEEAGFLSQLPSLATTAKAERPSPLAVVLAEGQGGQQPAVVYQPYGTGRVVAIEGAGMWRWAFLAPEHQQHELVYESLWQGLTRWLVTGSGLAPGQNVALRTDKVTFVTKESAAAILLVREEEGQSLEMAVKLLRGNEEMVGSYRATAVGDEPGVYRVSFGPLPEGQYLARLESADNADSLDTSVTFDVRPNYSEQLDVAARPDLLARIADESGGAVLDDVQSSEVGKRFNEHLAQSRPVQMRETTAWDRSWVLIGIVGLWGVAWGLRRTAGLT